MACQCLSQSKLAALPESIRIIIRVACCMKRVACACTTAVLLNNLSVLVCALASNRRAADHFQKEILRKMKLSAEQEQAVKKAMQERNLSRKSAVQYVRRQAGKVAVDIETIT